MRTGRDLVLVLSERRLSLMVLTVLWRCWQPQCRTYVFSPGPRCPRCGVLGTPVRRRRW